MKEKIKKVWKDPVGSKLISFLIIGLITLIYNYSISIIKNKSFKSIFISFWKTEFYLWEIFLFFSLTMTTLFFLLNYRKNKTNNKVNIESDNFIYDDESKKLDTELFLKIRDELLPNSSINWLRYQDFGNSFRSDAPDKLFYFGDNYNDPSFEFFNLKLDSLKEKLKEKIEVFTNLLSKKTFPQGSISQTIPPEWRTERPNQFKKDVNSLNHSSKELIESYDLFIKEGRKILKVSSINK